MKLYKVSLDITAYIFANDVSDASNKISDHLKGLIDESEDFSFDNTHFDEVERDTDYRYEIFDKENNLIEGGDGYCCLDTAIEYALENNGEYIKEVYYYLDNDGQIDADDFTVVSSREMWKRD